MVEIRELNSNSFCKYRFAMKKVVLKFVAGPVVRFKFGYHLLYTFIPLPRWRMYHHKYEHFKHGLKTPRKEPVLEPKFSEHAGARPKPKAIIKYFKTRTVFFRVKIFISKFISKFQYTTISKINYDFSFVQTTDKKYE